MAAALSFAGLPGMIQKYIKMRCVMTEYKMVLPVLAAFIVSVVLGPIIIPYLRKLKMGQTERESLPWEGLFFCSPQWSHPCFM